MRAYVSVNLSLNYAVIFTVMVVKLFVLEFVTCMWLVVWQSCNATIDAATSMYLFYHINFH